MWQDKYFIKKKGSECEAASCNLQPNQTNTFMLFRKKLLQTDFLQSQI